MHESQIQDIVDSITLNKLSWSEKAIIVADVKNELCNKRLAGNIMSLVLSKVEDLNKGLYKESQSALPKIFQDFSEKEAVSKPFEVKKDEIDNFLEKMTSKKFDGNVFSDTHDFYHITDVMRAEGVPQHRSDFNVK